MGRLLIRWIFLALAVWAAAHVTQALGLGFKVDVHDADDTIRFFIGVAVLALLNATLGTILKFLTLPLNCLTLGLFSLVINALILWLTATLHLGFHLVGTDWHKFLAAFVGSLLISVINGFLGILLPDSAKEARASGA